MQPRVQKCVPRGADGYRLLGEPFDSKEVAIVVENFVIRGKAFFPPCLRWPMAVCHLGTPWPARGRCADDGNTAEKSLPTGRYSLLE